MAGDIRTFTLSSTGGIIDLVGSSTGMPQGMYSSISSDGTTFVLDGHPDEITALSSGALTITAQGNDEQYNAREATVGIQWEIINASATYTTYTLRDLFNHKNELVGQFLANISFTSDFTIDPISFAEHFGINFENGGVCNFIQYDDTHAYLAGEVIYNDTQVNLSLLTTTNANPPVDNYANSFLTDYGKGDKDSRLGIFTLDMDNLLKVESTDASSDLIQYGGECYITFGKVASSTFALKMN